MFKKNKLTKEQKTARKIESIKARLDCAAICSMLLFGAELVKVTGILGGIVLLFMAGSKEVVHANFEGVCFLLGLATIITALFQNALIKGFVYMLLKLDEVAANTHQSGE